MSDKKEAKIRTSITMAPEVLTKLRYVSDQEGISVSAFIEKAIDAVLQHHENPPVVAPVTTMAAYEAPEAV